MRSVGTMISSYRRLRRGPHAVLFVSVSHDSEKRPVACPSVLSLDVEDVSDQD